jgi:hypothetical protein
MEYSLCGDWRASEQTGSDGRRLTGREVVSTEFCLTHKFLSYVRSKADRYLVVLVRVWLRVESIMSTPKFLTFVLPNRGVLRTTNQISDHTPSRFNKSVRTTCYYYLLLLQTEQVHMFHLCGKRKIARARARGKSNPTGQSNPKDLFSNKSRRGLDSVCASSLRRYICTE